jgi:GMP reductase
MKIENEIRLDYSDVLICPKRSESPSRKNVNLIRKFTFLNSQETWEGVPIMAANMATTGTFAMAQALNKHHMSTCLHKFYSIEQLVQFFKTNDAFYTLGIKEEDFAKLNSFVQSNGSAPKYICLDVANGYTKYFVEKCRQLRNQFPKSVLLAGNVCTPEMVQELLLSGGVDIVKIGIGGGSACTTRIVTGVGFPQLSAVIECADAAHGLRGHIVADGGCTTSGDVSKAFGAGADFVMLGGMLSGHEECEGDWEYEWKAGVGLQQGEFWQPFDPGYPTERKKKSLRFFGMSSKEAMNKFNGGQSNYKASEGRSVSVPYRGVVEDTVLEILGGIRSTCTYVGTETLKDLSKCCTFIRVNNTHNRVFEK